MFASMIAYASIIAYAHTQVSQVSSSNAMEKFGFISLVEKLETENIKIRSVTSDRHRGLRSYLASERKDIIHQFDVLMCGM